MEKINKEFCIEKHKTVVWKYRRKECKRSFISFPCANKNRLFLTIMIYILTLSYFPIASSQQLGGGLFPGIKDLSSFKPVTASSTCGINNNPTSFCISSQNMNSLSKCDEQSNRRTCLLGCCQNCGSSTPNFIDLDKFGTVTSGVYISADRRSGSDVFSNSKEFINGYMTYSNYQAKFNFTFAGWVKLKVDKLSVLLEKTNIFVIKIAEYKMEITYFTSTSVTAPNTIKFVNINLKLKTWNHLAVIVCGHNLALFINGKLERTETLVGIINDKLAKLRLGQSSQGYEQFSGLLQEVKMYEKGLTNREVVEAMTGKLPEVPYTNCRCPESHPRLVTANPFYCMKNSGTGTTQRLSPESHPVEYLVDGQVITYWLSEMVEDVTIDIDLKYSRLHIYLVSIMFYSPPPMGMKIERSLDFGKTYQPWQYFAVDCMASYNMENNGVLHQPDSVNCLQINSPKPTWETITFQPAEAGPENKPQRPFGTPGCNDFHCSNKLIEFVQATNVRIVFKGHALVSHPDHNYFGVRRIIVGGTCDCYGHATECSFDDTASPNPNYKCICEPRTHTNGEQCEQCLPLYQDKVFARGTVLDANPCKKCECYDHAESCFYDAALDLYPNDRTKLGGGVCVGCKDNTMGRFCDQCKQYYYRPTGKAKNTVDVCQRCDCDGPGTKNGFRDCQKDDSTSGILAGQCTCKLYVAGRQCTQCQLGYYQLSSLNPEGCIKCRCNSDGTQKNGQSCHISSGQCQCKQNVIGVKCTNCKPGYYGLSSHNPLGCSPCNCNPLGSDLAASCNVQTGQCKCKDKFVGQSCDQCKSGYFGPTCQPCLCNGDGTIQGSSSACNADSGVCSCKLYVDGKTCDSCKTGYYGLSKNNPQGCTSCNCDVKGTKGNSGTCQLDGSCSCKTLVTGQTCNLCKVGSYELSQSKADGCTSCNCNARGTVSGDRIPEAELTCTLNGQCSCISNVIGLQCNQCISGYYWNPIGLGCLPCNCDPLGSQSSICNSTGYCICKTGVGLDGLRCDQCAPGFYNYKNGRCESCSCSPSGSLKPHCDSFGRCLFCKQNVEGYKCDQCRPNTKDLQASNPVGCSGYPSEQSPPSVVSESPRSITLSWLPPDKANGIITKYELYRNGSMIYTGLMQLFNDTNLSPYSTYVYELKVFTEGGSSTSVDNLVHKTLSDIPENLLAPIISEVKERSVILTWHAPSPPNGIISAYVVNSSTSSTNNEVYKGIDLSYQVTGLTPFTSYFFSVSACNNIGCIVSDNATVTTRSTAPDSQPAPYATPLSGGKSILITWDAPANPNGQIQFYDLYIRDKPFVGEGKSIAAKLNPKVRQYTAGNLKPFTDFEFRVISYTAQVAASAKSDWSRKRTLEANPSGILSISPIAISLSSTTMNISWSLPQNPNGVIQRFEIYMYDESSSYILPFIKASTDGNTFKTTITNLQSYKRYQFSVKACNSVGCTAHSNKVTATTKPSTPTEQNPPIGNPINSSSVMLQWEQPNILNGPTVLNFIVERSLPPFNSPPEVITEGIRFPGFGYYRFSGDLIPASSNTLIEFYFKTRYLDGTMFFASSSNQGDILVIEFRDGCPWFVFDTESGSTAFSISKNKTFNDNEWHHVLLTRTSRAGSILIDGVYRGSGYAEGTKNVISLISNVYIGALPQSFRITRTDDGNMTLKRMPFIGCIKLFKYKNQLVDFATALETYNISPLSNFCPAQNDAGLYFKGGGYLMLKSGIFKGIHSFQMSFRFRTLDKTAPLVLVISENDDFFALYFKDQILILQYKTSSDAGYFMLSSVSFCDGEWHNVNIENNARHLSSNIDGVRKTITQLPVDFVLDRPIYIGGVPSHFNGVQAMLKTLNINTYYTGCLSNLKIGNMIYLPGAVEEFHNIDFDGCPINKGISVQCSKIQIEKVYDGQERSVIVTGMETFTEYLFRIKSYHQDTSGYAVSKWVPLRSGEGVPRNLAIPSVTFINATSITLSWKPPSISGGLILYYNINNYDKILSTKKSTKVDNFLSGSLYDLSPATLYDFTVEAFTSVASVESEAVQVKTKAAAPVGFDIPAVTSTPNSLNISWSPPVHPNGDIIFYQVELDGRIKYSGKAFSVFIKDLTVYTKYMLRVTVCGEADCTFNELNVYTGQLSPFGVIAPQLRVLGSKRIEVKWTLPAKINGLIQRYEVLLGLTTNIFDLRSVFNSSATTFQTVVGNLIPGTLYYFRMKAFTKAGGTLGDASSIKTVESVPENIPLPKVLKKTSTEVTLQLFKPASPNGDITQYILLQNNLVILDQTSLPGPFTVKNLIPNKKYLFQVKVCTAQGCGLTNPIEIYTEDGKPVGTIGLVTFGVTSSTVESMWNALASPNGLLTYTLIAVGSFITDPKSSFESYNGTKTCYSGNVADVKVLCHGLLPFERYTIYVNASNTAGFVLSNKKVITTYFDVPFGVEPPLLTVLNSSAILLSWKPPVRDNGNIEKYILYGRYPSNTVSGYETVKIIESLETQHLLTELKPYTEYLFWIEVYNNIGKTTSKQANATTNQDVPSGLDAPQLSYINSKKASIEISPPSQPNGIITQYITYVNNTVVNKTKETTVHIFGLKPYTWYSVHVGACTNIGCFNSTSTYFRTFQDAPEGISPPILTTNGSISVIIRWSKPTSTNGVILKYLIQRRLSNNTNVVLTVATLNASFWNTYVDTSVQAFTSYDYRIVAETAAGSTPSLFNTVKTPEGGPQGISAPQVIVLSSSSILVRWSAPTDPNGKIISYFIKASGILKRVNNIPVLEYLLGDLQPFVKYHISIRACTQGGCEDGPSTFARTQPATPEQQLPPTAKVLSNTSLRVQWKEPLLPNGPISYYILESRTLESVITESILSPTPWTVLLQSSATKFDHAGLGVYSLQQYKVTCFTSVGNAASNLSTPYRTGPGVPLLGPTLTATAINHTSVSLSWIEPLLTSLRGVVLTYTISYEIVQLPGLNIYGKVPGNISTVVVGFLRPSTLYDFTVVLFNGAGRKSSPSVRVKTLNGIPEGFDKPVIYSIAAYDIKVFWTIPRVPNGDIVNYTIVANDVKLDTVKGDVTFHHQKQLRPYTNYIIKIQVCTQFICILSDGVNVQTKQAAPTDMMAPQVVPLTSTSLQVSWQPPLNTNGIMVGYEVYRRNNESCTIINPTPTGSGICLTSWMEILQNNRDSTKLSIVDTTLLAKTKYEYYIVGINTVGNVTSQLNSSVTLMDGPDQLDPPNVTLVSDFEISIIWTPPRKANGEISKYILYRAEWLTKQETLVYEGKGLSHLDRDNLKPYTGYMYIISACTNVCIKRNALALIYTGQSMPDGVLAPVLKALSPISVQINWSIPLNPNGVITKYDVMMLQNGSFVSILPANNLGEMLYFAVDSLKPFTEYTFRIKACTIKGCTDGPTAKIKTLETAPVGLFPPRVFVRNSRSVEIEWSSPPASNGVIQYYLLYRNRSMITNQTERGYIDNNVLPNRYYGYYIEAYSNGGAGASDEVVIKTPKNSPKGINKPILQSTSATSIRVVWSPPTSPNGLITSYTVLYQEIDSDIIRKNVGLVTTTTLNGLKPNTEYIVRIQVCTLAECGIGEKGVVKTLESLPSGIDPPTTIPKSSTIIEVSWSSPKNPNGEIKSFQVERRQGINGLPFIIYVGLATIYLDTQLQPFSSYQYRVRAANTVGDVISEWITVKTLDGIPENIPAPKVNVINSTHVTVEWGSPDQSNGQIKEYSIRVRRFSQVGNESLIQCCIPANVAKYVIGGLQPAVSYEFQIIATTSGGSGFGSWTVATTPEAPPVGNPVLKVNTDPDGSNDGTSMEVYWDEPSSTNGVVTSYILYEDTYVVYQGEERKALIRRLDPFTNYTFQLAVCNTAGCTKGPKQTLTSGEIKPKGLLPPVVTYSNSTVARLEWKPPLFPNGKISLYELIRENVQKTRRRRTENIIFSSADALIYVDNGLQSFTIYRYKVRTSNSRGSVESDWVTITTDEAPPQGLITIVLVAVAGPVVQIDWQSPSNDSGIVRYYDIYRNKTRIDSSSLTSYVDKSQMLQPSSVYEYYVSACTAAGCSKGEPKLVVTLASTPQSVIPPVLIAIDSSQVKATWKAPVQVNGVIEKYRLFLDESTNPVFEGLAFEYTVTGLETYTKYSLKVAACTATDCMFSRNAQVTTLEDIPEELERPELFSLSLYSIEVRWKSPKKPNGVILYYSLLRDDNLIYNGTDTRYLDRDVSAGIIYGYTVTAFNTAGSKKSSITYGSTSSSGAPKNVSKPSLQALDSENVIITWDEPVGPTISRYLLLFNNKEIDIGKNREYTATGLNPFTSYDFRIKACANLACTTSEASSIQTLEAAPESQFNPYFDIDSVKEASIRIRWYEPLKPNGVIIKYELYRKITQLDPKLIYNGPDESFTDSGPEIIPNTQYQYKVIAFNSVGNTSSLWSVVTTTNAVPQGVLPIEPVEILSASFSFRIREPTKSNGNIKNYVLEIFDPQNSSLPNLTTTALTGSVFKLQEFTEYRTRLYACNSVGCSSSPYKTIRTKGTVPIGFKQPVIDFRTSRIIGLSWEEPLQTFGTVTSYEIILTHQCPQLSKPICEMYVRRYDSRLSKSYNITELTPYTFYIISVEVRNEAGTTFSPTITVSTLAEAPIVVGELKVNIMSSAPNTIIVDWKDTFDLRSEFVGFVVYENLLEAYSGDMLTLERANREVGSYTYSVKAITKVDNVLTSVSTQDVTVAVGTVLPTTAAQTGDDWYTKLWFLALCALILLIIIIIIALCCCRGYRRNRSVYVRQREPLPIKSKLVSRAPSVAEFDERQSQVAYTPSRQSMHRFSGNVSTSKPGTPSTSKYRINNEMLGVSMKESRFNESYTEDDDLVWDTLAHSKRDELDSGLYDETPSPLVDDQLAGSSAFLTLQKERILFPDTHL